MSKQKRREKRKYKQVLKQLKACDACATIAAIGDFMERKGLGGANGFRCPRCQRELLVPISPDGVGQELFEKSLRAVGKISVHSDKPYPTHFRFTVNGREILADPGWDSDEESNVVCDVKFQLPEEDFVKWKGNEIGSANG